MVVHSAHNQWTVPPNRGFWMPCGHVHSLRCVGALKMRSVFVRPDSFPNLPTETKAVSISPLLSELIKASVEFETAVCRRLTGCTDHAPDPRSELALLPALPLSLPQPADPRINQICLAWQDDPGDASTVADWSERLALDQKTIQRLFRKETGMTFGQWRQRYGCCWHWSALRWVRRLSTWPGLGYESPKRLYQHVQETSLARRRVVFPLTPSVYTSSELLKALRSSGRLRE